MVELEAMVLPLRSVIPVRVPLLRRGGRGAVAVDVVDVVSENTVAEALQRPRVTGVAVAADATGPLPPPDPPGRQR